MTNFRKFFPYLFCLAAFLYVLFLYNAVPFISVPNTGITVWAVGFARSIANAPWFSIFAPNIGYPRPAGISFGLPGILPTAWLIKLGMRDVDAYVIILDLYIALGFWGSAKLARHFGLPSPTHFVAGFVWVSLPILWQHTYFSYLAIGFMLLPIYIGVHLWALKQYNAGWRWGALAALGSIGTIIFALFMDGYSFIYMLTAFVIIGAFGMIGAPTKQRRMIMIAEIVMMVGLLSAIWLYTNFFGQHGVNVADLDFIRGFGLDLSFLISPSKGLYWFFDTLGISAQRGYSQFFGDDSVWNDTYITPLLVCAFAVLFASKGIFKKSTPYLALLLVGFYLSLGPSLKFNSQKPTDFYSDPRSESSIAMDAKYAIIPTGSEVLYEYLPPIRVLRASYRWLVLAGFGAWAIWVIAGASFNNKNRVRWGLLSILMIVLTTPHFDAHVQNGVANRNYFTGLEKDLYPLINHQVHQGEIVYFYPIGNDFLVNEIAAAGNFRSYNIGGDKNLAAAMEYYPPELLPTNDLIAEDPPAGIRQLFRDVEVDVVVIPFIDLWENSFRQAPFSANLGLEKNSEILRQFDSVLNDPAYETTVSEVGIFIREVK